MHVANSCIMLQVQSTNSTIASCEDHLAINSDEMLTKNIKSSSTVIALTKNLIYAKNAATFGHILSII